MEGGEGEERGRERGRGRGGVRRGGERRGGEERRVEGGGAVKPVSGTQYVTRPRFIHCAATVHTECPIAPGAWWECPVAPGVRWECPVAPGVRWEWSVLNRAWNQPLQQ